jgi:hypothetical protein
LRIVADRLRRWRPSLEIGRKHLRRRVIGVGQRRWRLEMRLVGPVKIPRTRLGKRIMVVSVSQAQAVAAKPTVALEPCVPTQMTVVPAAVAIAA